MTARATHPASPVGTPFVRRQLAKDRQDIHARRAITPSAGSRTLVIGGTNSRRPMTISVIGTQITKRPQGRSPWKRLAGMASCSGNVASALPIPTQTSSGTKGTSIQPHQSSLCRVSGPSGPISQCVAAAPSHGRPSTVRCRTKPTPTRVRKIFRRDRGCWINSDQPATPMASNQVRTPRTTAVSRHNQFHEPLIGPVTPADVRWTHSHQIKHAALRASSPSAQGAWRRRVLQISGFLLLTRPPPPGSLR